MDKSYWVVGHRGGGVKDAVAAVDGSPQGVEVEKISLAED